MLVGCAVMGALLFVLGSNPDKAAEVRGSGVAFDQDSEGKVQ